MVIDSLKANQWHGAVRIRDGQDIKISFIEDAHYRTYPAHFFDLNGLTLIGEPIEGLYHRKLLTVSRSTPDGLAEGGRQKARDLFDLFVLTQAHSPIKDFANTVPYGYFLDSFIDGLDGMRWFELVNDMSRIDSASEWSHGKDIENVRKRLYLDCGIDLDQEFEEASEPTKPKWPKP